MESEIPLPISPGLLARGFLAAIILSLMMISSGPFNRIEIKPILKGPRPYIRLSEYTLKPIKGHRPKKSEKLYRKIVFQAADQYRVEPAMINAIIMAESGYNPHAVSKRGAVGLMQLMPDTADDMGVEDRLDPVHNIYGGVRYFRKLMNMFEGDVFLALSAYNAGIEKVKEYNGVPPFRATRFYVIKVLRYYQYYKGRQEEESSKV